MVGMQEELREAQEKITDIKKRIKQSNQRQERLMYPGAR
jgi:hypothetical protein